MSTATAAVIVAAFPIRVRAVHLLLTAGALDPVRFVNRIQLAGHHFTAVGSITARSRG